MSRNLHVVLILCLFFNVTFAQQSLYTWGDNEYGKLGNGTLNSTFNPTLIGTGKWRVVDGGDFFSVGIQSDGSLWTWGDQADGHLGNGSTTGTTTGVQIPSQIGTDKNWDNISVGQGYTLAIKNDGTLWAWGQNIDLCLGSGSSLDLYIPTQIGTAADWKSVYAGNSHALAIKNDGTLWAWGDNNHSKLGDGTSVDKSAAVQVGVSTDWVTASAGNNTSFAVKSDGSLWTWGENTLNTGDISAPSQLGTETDWALIHSSEGSHFGIKKDGSLWAWGNNMLGQLGLGGAASFKVLIPTQVGSDKNWQDIVGGYMHSVALKTDGTIWGMGAGNSIGMNAPLGEKIPKQIGTANTWKSISSGRTHMLALGGNGTSSVMFKESANSNPYLFPNPAADVINVYSELPVRSVSILSLSGNALITSQESTLNISNLANGLYLYRITFENHPAYLGKFVKQ